MLELLLDAALNRESIAKPSWGRSPGSFHLCAFPITNISDIVAQAFKELTVARQLVIHTRFPFNFTSYCLTRDSRLRDTGLVKVPRLAVRVSRLII